MKKYEIKFSNKTFVIYDYEDGLRPEIFYEENNVLYDEGNGFPDVSVVDPYLYVYDNWKKLVEDK